MFDWNDLTFFLELARHGRLGPTARRLRVDSATVSRRVAELERALDCKLFDRTADGFDLTEAGHRLLPEAETMEAQAAIAAEAASGAASERRVRLAMMEGIASQYVASRLPRLLRDAPTLAVELVTSPALFNLTRREADVSLSFVPPQGRGLEIRRIGAFALFLYASPAYLAAHGTPLAREDLRQHVFVDYVPELVQIPEVHWLLDVISAPRVSLRSSSMFAQQTAAASDAGLVLLPSFAGEADPRLQPVLKPTVRAERPIFLAVHKDLEHLPRIRLVTRFLEETIRTDRAFLLGEP